MKIKFDWKSIDKPIIALAPMEGYTDSAFRQIVKKLAPSVICWTEFASADAIKVGAKKVIQKFKFNKKENPLIVQLFGKNLESFAEAAKIIEQSGAAGVDINMGCPAKKVIASQHGSALMKNPELATKIVETIKKNCKIPVSVKTRLGFNEANTASFYQFCTNLINAGASCLTIHGRTTKQGFSGISDWKPIYELKNKHPETTIIGCGDITSAKEATSMIKNLDGIMVGRATIGNPWIMSEIVTAFNKTKQTPPLTLKQKIPLILEHCKLSIEQKGDERLAMLEMRKILSAYIKGIDNASKIRTKLVQIYSLAEAKKILNSEII